jgi:hyaluronoglucosaminidase
MTRFPTFQRRGIVEGFFGPLWSMSHRKALFDFGAARGMNTYLYGPKDDPYHRARWTQAYPLKQWNALLQLIRHAQKRKIDFVYGFHPGKGLCFSDRKPVEILLAKAQRFHDAGVRTFAILFDDIPSRLEHAADRNIFNNSLARAQGTWLQKIQGRQPARWKDVEWWICPSYYTPDPLLARVFGSFEAHFLETLAEVMPADMACLWTGPSVVSKTITLAHVQKIAKQINHRLILWDNYPVNDLSMADELHIGPLQGRDSRLSQATYGYLNNPLLQEELSFIPLATCFDYAANPAKYKAEASWTRIIGEHFGIDALSHWQSIRNFCEASQRSKKAKRPSWLSSRDRLGLKAAHDYIREHRKQKWALEIQPWRELMLEALSET